jgi:predicted nucleic acid-binding protein
MATNLAIDDRPLGEALRVGGHRTKKDTVTEALQEYIETDDYEDAASFFDHCRAKGIKGSNTDLLICAAAVCRQLTILTADDDSSHFARVHSASLPSIGQCVAWTA